MLPNLIRISVFTVILLLSSCATHNGLRPPLQLIDPSGFTAKQTDQILDLINELNKEIGRDIIINSRADASIFIKWRKEFPKQNPDSKVITIGQATISKDQCTIELSEWVTTDPDWLHTTLWHEIGHCFGLNHVSEEHQIMSSMATPFDEIERAAIDLYIAALRSK